MRSWGSVITLNYRGRSQSCTLHEQNTLTLLTSEGWNEEKTSTGTAAGTQMSEQKAMCWSAPSELWSGLSQHILQRLTITLFCTDSPFQLGCSSTYWQRRERVKEKQIRSNINIALKACSEVCFYSSLLVSKWEGLIKLKPPYVVQLFNVQKGLHSTTSFLPNAPESKKPVHQQGHICWELG